MKLEINTCTWASALSHLPFSDLEMLVRDMCDSIGTVESLHRESDSLYELYDLLHTAIENKWTFDDCNTEKIPRDQIDALAKKT